MITRDGQVVSTKEAMRSLEINALREAGYGGMGPLLEAIKGGQTVRACGHEWKWNGERSAKRRDSEQLSSEKIENEGEGKEKEQGVRETWANGEEKTAKERELEARLFSL